jgi:hypothetical protein
VAGVEHATLVEVRDGEPVLETTSGGAPSGLPKDVGIWVARAVGPGTQELTWTPEDGDWAVLVMNPDATRGVDVTVTAGAEVPSMPWIIGILLSLAGTSLVAAVILIAAPLRAVSRQAGEQR